VSDYWRLRTDSASRLQFCQWLALITIVFHWTFFGVRREPVLRDSCVSSRRWKEVVGSSGCCG
jgi:hypothetical protein